MADQNCDAQAISNKEAFINAGTSKGCDSNLSDYLLSIFDKVVGDVVKVVYEGLVQSNFTLILTLGALYIAFYGYKVFSGRSEDTLQEALWLFVKLTMVYAFLFNYPTFHYYVFSFFTYTPHEVWGKALSLSGYHVMNSTSPNDTLDIFFTKGMALAGLAAEFGGMMGYAMFAVVGFGTLLISGMVLLLLIVAKVMTAIYLLLAPIFLLLWLFSVTKGSFQNWLQGLFTFWFITIMTYALMVFMFAVLQYPLVDLSQELKVRDEIVASDLFAIILLGLVTYWIFKRLFTFAAQLGGGVALEAYKPIRTMIENNVRPGAQRLLNEQVYDRMKRMTRR